MREACHPFGLHPFGTEPCLQRTSSPCCQHESYRHAERLAQRLAEVIGCRTKVAYALRLRLAPAALHIVYGMQPGIAFHGEKAKKVVLTGHQFVGSSLHRLRREPLHRHLHIALSRADPHLSDEHIVQGKRLTIGQRDVVRSASLRRAHSHPPLALSIDLGFVGSSIPRCAHLHLFARIGSSPQIAVGLLLQHHVVSKNLWHFHFCLRHKSQGEENS